MRHFLLLLFLPLLLISCNKKELDEIELAPPVTWEAHKEFIHNRRFIANLHGTDDRLYVLGLNLFSKVSLAAGEEKVEHAYHFYNGLAEHKLPLNRKVFVGAFKDALVFRSSLNPVDMGSYLTIIMDQVDPHFRSFELIMSNSVEAIGLSENNVALVPYYAYDKEKNEHLGRRFLLVKLTVESDGFYEKVTLQEARVLNYPLRSSIVRYIKAYGDYFYLSTDNGFVRVSEDGTVEPILSDQIVTAIFPHKGNLYAITWNGPRQSNSLYVSATGGNWTRAADLSSAAEMLSYYPVSDTLLLASYNSQLFKVDLDSGMSVKELDNTGLEGHFINSMAKVKDKVYVGTLSGLFVKDAKHLLTYKDEE